MKYEDKKPFELSLEILGTYPSLQNLNIEATKQSASAVYTCNRTAKKWLDEFSSGRGVRGLRSSAIPYHFLHIKCCLQNFQSAQDTSGCEDFINTEQAILAESEQRWPEQERKWFKSL